MTIRETLLALSIGTATVLLVSSRMCSDPTQTATAPAAETICRTDTP